MLVVIQIFNLLSLLTLVASLLAILGLRIATGSTSQQIDLIRVIRSSAERASRNCVRARSTALIGEFQSQRQGQPGHSAKVVSLSASDHSCRHFVEESDRLIRTLADVAKDSGDMRVAKLRLRLNALKRVEKESIRQLIDLEALQRQRHQSFTRKKPQGGRASGRRLQELSGKNLPFGR
ncbi:MAG: hypothetical protein NTW20_06635 [Rhodobacterales bacterium]|nr:hypothetical protein [Rhodobacterales bacterium]